MCACCTCMLACILEWIPRLHTWVCWLIVLEPGIFQKTYVCMYFVCECNFLLVYSSFRVSLFNCESTDCLNLSGPEGKRMYQKLVLHVHEGCYKWFLAIQKSEEIKKHDVFENSCIEKGIDPSIEIPQLSLACVICICACATRHAKMCVLMVGHEQSTSSVLVLIHMYVFAAICTYYSFLQIMFKDIMFSNSVFVRK